jgi:hypothetical protein
VACDGKIKIYDMSDSTPLLLKIIEGVVASSEPEYVLSWLNNKDTQLIRQLDRIVLCYLEPIWYLLCCAHQDQWFVLSSPEIRQEPLLTDM